MALAALPCSVYAYNGSGEGYMKTIKNVLRTATALVLIFILGCVAIDQFVSISASQFINKPEQMSGDVILVLGAHVTPQKKPSEMLADRLDTALELYENGVSDKILVSGDHSSLYYNEVAVMKAYLVERGVPERDIYMDHSGFSTYESVVRAKAIFGVDSLVISTQAYHLKRAVYIARALGLDAYGVSADIQLYPGIFRYRGREFLARIKDFFYVHVVRPEPTHLGEPTPIRGY